MVEQDTNFKICFSFFGWKELKTVQRAICVLVIEPVHRGYSSILLVTFLGHPVDRENAKCTPNWDRDSPQGGWLWNCFKLGVRTIFFSV